MTESRPFAIYGIKTVALNSRSTGLPYGRYRVLAGGEINLTSEKVALMGGAQRFPWAHEFGVFESEIRMTVREYPEFGFKYMLQGSSVIQAAETTGNVGSLTNVNGTTVAAGTTGIAAVAAIAGSESNLKTGRYIVKATGSYTVDVYYLGSKYDSYEDDVLKVTSAALTIPGTSGTVNLTAFGLTFTGRSTDLGMVSNATARFDVRKVNTGAEVIEIGKSSETPHEFEAFFFAEDRSNGDQFYVHAPKCVASGLPISLNEKAFSESEVTFSFDYDPALDYALKIYKIKG
jgi:hypothetical protein